MKNRLQDSRIPKGMKIPRYKLIRSQQTVSPHRSKLTENHSKYELDHNIQDRILQTKQNDFHIRTSKSQQDE